MSIKMKLKEIANVEMGQSPDSNYVFEYDDLGMPFLQGNADFGDINPSPQFYCSKPLKQAQKGDILISVRAPVGAVNLADQSYCIGRGLAAIRPKNSHISSKLFQNIIFANKQSLIRVAQGSTFEAISKNDLLEMDIYVPKSDLIQKIDNTLDVIELTISQTRIIIEKLIKKKQGLLNDLLTRGVDSHGNLRPSYEDAPDLYQETELGFIPKEWEILSVSDFSDFVTSGSRGWASYYAESGALFIRIGNLSRENLDMRFESVVYVNPPKSADGLRTKLQEGDILISITADLGIIGVVPKKFGDAFINQHVALVRPKEGFNSRFIGYYLASSQSQKQIETYNDGGAKAGLNLPTIRNLKVALPNTVSEQNAIAEKLDAINSQILSSKKELNKLEQIKIGLLKDLLQN